MAKKIIKTFEYKIKHTSQFAKRANEVLEHCRFVYNCALEHRILRYRQGNPVGLYDQFRELTLARKLPWVRAYLCTIQRDALERLDRAFKAFFERVQSGKTPGFPRFKNTQSYSTFSQKLGSDRPCPLIGSVLRVPGVGTVRVRLSRPIEGTVKQLRITRRADGWYALLVCEIPKPAPLTKTGNSIGVDVGLSTFATLSNGEKIDNPRHLRNAERALKRSQRVLAAKKRGSSNRLKARQRLALRHLKVRRARKDFHHKTAADLVLRFDAIAVEDLKIENMRRNHRLAKSIADAGWGQFTEMLAYKAENAGREFVKVDPRYTSQDCSACGHRQKMPLALRVFVCAKCGHTLCRDVNAAINIEGRGAPGLSTESHEGLRSRNRHGVVTKIPPTL